MSLHCQPQTADVERLSVNSVKTYCPAIEVEYILWVWLNTVCSCPVVHSIAFSDLPVVLSTLAFASCIFLSFSNFPLVFYADFWTDLFIKIQRKRTEVTANNRPPLLPKKKIPFSAYGLPLVNTADNKKDDTYREIFFITNIFLKVTQSFRNPSGSLLKWRLLLFAGSFHKATNCSIKYGKVVVPITFHCRSLSMNVYDLTDRAWKQMVFLANNTYFFPLAIFFTFTFSSQFCLPVQIYFADQVLICKMFSYFRSRWFTDAAKNNVKQTQWGAW